MKTIKNFLFVALFSVTGAFSQTIWNGTADISWYDSSQSEFTITTAEQLAGLAQLTNDWRYDFYGKTIKLGANIMLNDTTNWKNWRNQRPANKWTTMNCHVTFDGCGYVVSGVYVNENNKVVNEYNHYTNNGVGFFAISYSF